MNVFVINLMIMGSIAMQWRPSSSTVVVGLTAHRKVPPHKSRGFQIILANACGIDVVSARIMNEGGYSDIFDSRLRASLDQLYPT